MGRKKGRTSRSEASPPNLILGREQKLSDEEERLGDTLVLGLTDCWPGLVGGDPENCRCAGVQRLGTGRESLRSACMD